LHFLYFIIQSVRFYFINLISAVQLALRGHRNLKFIFKVSNRLIAAYTLKKTALLEIVINVAKTITQGLGGGDASLKADYFGLELHSYLKC
jgi:hypothetical protein